MVPSTLVPLLDPVKPTVSPLRVDLKIEPKNVTLAVAVPITDEAKSTPRQDIKSTSTRGAEPVGWSRLIEEQSGLKTT